MNRRIYRCIAAVGLCVAISLAAWPAHAARPSSEASASGFGQLALTWQQANTSGFSDPLTVEVSALESFNGYLYAGTTNQTNLARVYRSADGATWDPASPPGFGIPHDTAPRAIVDMAVFGGRLYAASGRSEGPAHLHRTANGTTWTPMTVTGFGNPDTKDITALVVFKDMLYAAASNAATGWQIWRSSSGDNNTWTQVAPAQPGSGPSLITGFAEYGGELYAAVQSDGPAQVWRSATGALWEPVVSDGFGDSNVTTTGGLAVLAGELFVGAGHKTLGAQLWRTSDGVHWTQAITPGFDNAANTQVDAVFTHGNQLYVSTRNAQTGVELWSTPDLKEWTQANNDGFGDANNTLTNWNNANATFGSQLYVGTANNVDGGEIWRTHSQAPLRLYLPILAR